MTEEKKHIDLYLGLGTNLGDREGNLCSALSQLDKALGKHYDAVSDFIETQPWGFQSSDCFLNAAVKYELDVPRGTDMNAFAHGILSVCKGVERHMGRTEEPEYDAEGKRIYHSRIIDIDILLLGDERIDDDDLKIPHPLMRQRDFVMVPLNQII